MLPITHALLTAPSRWVTRWAPLMAAGGAVLDLACGSGRHLRWLAAQGWRVTGVDRDEAAVAPLRALAEIIVADIEGGPWPLADRRFDGIVVTNYLWRALMPQLVQALAPGGVLIYETFAQGHERFGRPSNPDFLLRHGELLSAFAALRIVAYEDGFEPAPERCVQRLVAVATDPDEAPEGTATKARESGTGTAAQAPQGPAAKIAAIRLLPPRNDP